MTVFGIFRISLNNTIGTITQTNRPPNFPTNGMFLKHKFMLWYNGTINSGTQQNRNGKA